MAYDKIPTTDSALGCQPLRSFRHKGDAEAVGFVAYRYGECGYWHRSYAHHFPEDAAPSTKATIGELLLARGM